MAKDTTTQLCELYAQVAKLNGTVDTCHRLLSTALDALEAAKDPTPIIRERLTISLTLLAEAKGQQ